MIKNIITIITLMACNLIYAQDVTLTLDGNNLNYTSSIEIAGFQFSHDGCVAGASGGEAQSAGFTVSASSSVVLGFSFTGSVLPAGDNLILTVLDGDIYQECLSDFVFSSPGGDPLDVELIDSSDGGLTSGCDLPINNIYLNGGDVWYNVDFDIGGFQWNVDGATVTATSGGDAGDAGFTVQGAGSTVLGFSFTGSYVPSGCGTLTQMILSGESTGISAIVFSTITGNQIDVYYYDESSGDDGGLCDDVDEDGICDDVDDCVGEDDECGVCNGDNSLCSGCTDIFGLNYDADATVDSGCEYADYQVEAGMYYYAPADLQVEPGQTVQWNNVSGFHDVVSISGPESFSLPAISGPALIGSITFNTVGVYEYICSIGNHEAQGMVGTITVGDGCTSGVYDCAGVCDGDAVWDCNNECDGSAVLDDCGECGGDNSSCQVDIFYESDADFFGFQFGVNGAIVVSASGGAAELNGFTVSTGGTTVIGFSFTGGFVPAGSGILTTLTIDGNADDVCLSDLVISGLSAALDSEVLDCLTISHEAAVLGCMDPDACNYNPAATSDDESCYDPEENFDCDGNCTVEIDCAGVCGGDAVEDYCGDCNGENSCFTLPDEFVGNWWMIYFGIYQPDCSGDPFSENSYELGDGNPYIYNSDGTGAFSSGLEFNWGIKEDTSEICWWNYDENDTGEIDCDFYNFDDNIMTLTLTSTEWGDCEIAIFNKEMVGCMDEDACNFDSAANIDSGDCEYESCSGVSISIDFVSGWNWFSINVEGESMAINDVLSTVDQGVYIKDQSGFSDYYEGFGWYGAIEEISVESTYKINLGTNESDELLYSGAPVDPSTRPIDLLTGWNWIGYLPQVSLPINDALESLGESGVYIKSQEGFSDYYAGFGWFGAVEQMSPLGGYAINMIDSATLLYPSGSTARVMNNFESNISSLDNFDYRQFEFNGSVMAEVNIEDINVSSSDILIAYVDGEYRGYTNAMLFPLTNKYIFPLMIHGNTDGEKVTFQYHNSALNQLFDLKENIYFESDMIIGNGLNTFELTGSDAEMVVGLDINAAYPNPFNPVTNLEYTLSQGGDVEIIVYDIMGRHVDTIYNGFQTNGVHSMSWDASNKSSGIYYIQVKSNNTIKTEKVVLMK